MVCGRLGDAMGEMLAEFSMVFSMYPTRILHTVTCLCRGLYL